MKEYILMHDNTALAAFSMNESEETESLIALVSQKEKLPLPLRKLLYFQGYIESEDKRVIRFNDEGCGEFDIWLINRAMPIGRVGKKSYIPDGYTRISWMLKNNAYALTDSYWIKAINSDLSRAGLIEFNRNRLDIIGGANTKYSGVNSTLGGNLEKYWYTERKGKEEAIMLIKKTSTINDILSIREVFASKIYEGQQFNNYCNYKYILNRENGIAGCKCKIFTSEGIELITAYDLLEEHGETQVDNQYEKIIQRAVEHGANKNEVEHQLSIQIIVDYLVTNRDRHQNNLGFLRDAKTLRILKMAPVYDSGSSAHLEGEKPEGIKNTTVNSMYNTEMECLSHADLRVIDTDKLPSKERLSRELDKSRGLSEYRKETLINLYEAKKKYIKHRKGN